MAKYIIEKYLTLIFIGYMFNYYNKNKIIPINL